MSVGHWREGDEGVAGLNAATVDDVGTFHDANTEPGKVVVLTSYIPGISAVSPPTSAAPASSQPLPIPETTAVATSTLSLPVA